MAKKPWSDYQLELVWAIVLMLLSWSAPTRAQLSVDEYWVPIIHDCPPDGPDCQSAGPQ